ncbi:MAG: 2'-5' RNA ligase family protein [Nanoarchaeota archaeon]
MSYAIAVLLPGDERIERFRAAKMPSPLPEPHITLVYPFSRFSGIQSHIRDVCGGTPPFTVTLGKVGFSENGFYLYLLPESGRRQLIGLHEALSSGPLEGHHNPEMPSYIPHLSIGIMQGEDARQQAAREAEGLRQTFRVESVQLLTIEEGRCVQVQSFPLGAEDF